MGLAFLVAGVVLVALTNRAMRDQARRPTLKRDLDRLRAWGRERLERLKSEMPPPSDEVYARESRELLQQTFDVVNANFGRLFPALFGGGQARLVLTGAIEADYAITLRRPTPTTGPVRLRARVVEAEAKKVPLCDYDRSTPAASVIVSPSFSPLAGSQTSPASGGSCRVARDFASSISTASLLITTFSIVIP